ncbi:MAG: hypothetical protein KIT83_05360 [Bryobacterales bacterium]|nr:hypothetical protein [Bryobacterales bacterium]
MHCYRTKARLAALSFLLAATLSAQTANAVEATVKGPVTVRRGEDLQVPVDVRVKKGLHINSHQPEDKYYIPLRITWDSSLAEARGTQFPEPSRQQFAFSEGKALSVFDGAFQFQQHFHVKPNATRGFGAITGKLTYQACNDKECFPPSTAPVRVTLDVR